MIKDMKIILIIKLEVEFFSDWLKNQDPPL